MQNTVSIKMQNLLNEVNKVIKTGVNNLVYDISLKHLTSELNKCKAEMEYYKNELESLKRNFSNGVEEEEETKSAAENIHLKIEECDKLFILDKNVKYDVIIKESNKVENSQIENPIISEIIKKEIKLEEEDEFEEEEEEEEDDEEDEEEEDESEEEEEDEEEEEEVLQEVVEEEKELVQEEELVEEEEVAESKEEEDEEEEEAEAEEEEDEVFEIEIDDVTYFATSEDNGPLYEVDNDGEPGNKVGHLKDGEPVFY